LKAPGVSESTYLTNMTSLVGASARSLRVSFGSDGGDITSTLTGLTVERSAALITAARTMAVSYGTEPAYVALGPLGGVVIADSDGNPNHHDEMLYPGLDSLNLTVLRSVPGQTGVFADNGRLFSTVGSDYVLIPQGRTMNVALETAYALLTTQLSRGIGKKPPNANGQVFALERDLLKIEGLVNQALSVPLKDQVAGYQFSLSRNDDISANSGAILTGTLAISSLAYIKDFKVIATFVQSFPVALAA
jgi:hypothetical protein